MTRPPSSYLSARRPDRPAGAALGQPVPTRYSQHDDWELEVRAVKDYLRALQATYPVPATRIDGRTRDGPAFCYDPWGFREAAQALWE